MWEIVTAGALFGGIASLHCVGMCGPIALMLPHPSTNPTAIMADNLSYNIGRATTYAIFGLIAGYFGSLIGLEGLQSSFSIAIGALMIAGYLFYRFIPADKLPFLGRASRVVAIIKRPFARLFQQKNRGSLFLLGMLNGLLPCGMVYAAVSMSLAMASPIDSALFMGAYGFGTFPAMTALYLMPKTFRGKVNGWAVKALPVMIFLAGFLLIWRGATAEPAIGIKANTEEICEY